MANAVFMNAALLTYGLQFAGFLAASALQTEVFYDILGGMNFLLLAWLGYSSSSERLWYLTILFCVSRGWLLVFLAWRAHNRKGDSRFDEVITKPMRFFVFWMVQATWVYLISLPLLVVQKTTGIADDDNDTLLTNTDYLLFFGFAFSIYLEISSDIQKTRWILDGRRGGFCQVGWWKYSRHPNYAGEIFQWLFAAILGCNSNSMSSFLSFLSPLFTMTILLTMSATGVCNAEGKNLKRYYESDNANEYTVYRQSTSPLIPMIGYATIPMSIKRALLFEWERYEYKPKNTKAAGQKQE